jgi:zinc/manganese transport system substrate-binding protein
MVIIVNWNASRVCASIENGYRYRVMSKKTQVLRASFAALVLAAPFALAACSGSDDSTGSATTTSAAAQCPVTPVNVVVSVDQWGDIVSELGGDCASVTTVLASSAVDPHDYEPAPSDAVKFNGAQLVVINGGHYDEWAAKLAASSAPNAPVVNALEASGAEHAHDEHGEDGRDDHADEGHSHDGETNPHVWYNPAAVTGVADAVTAELGKLAPDAAGYFDERRASFTETMKPYDAVIESIKANAAGKTYAATESVFDDMGAALGLTNRTPEGYQAASANEAEPSPADLDAFLRLLAARGVDMLIYNVQTEGSVPQQIRAAAEQAGVPVVEVTETVPPGTTSFESWQVNQLNALAKALGVPA